MSKESILAKIEELKAKPRPKKKAKPLSRQLKKALGLKPGDIARRAPELIQKIKHKLLPTRHHKAGTGRPRTILAKKLDSALAEHLAGESQKFVEEKYNLHNGLINAELKRRFHSTEEREQFLEDILLDNSILSALIFEKKADKMSGRDAAIATGIFTQRFSEFKKARQTGHQPDVPVAVVIQLNETLAKIRERHPNLALPDQDAIEIEGEQIQ